MIVYVHPNQREERMTIVAGEMAQVLDIKVDIVYECDEVLRV